MPPPTTTARAVVGSSGTAPQRTTARFGASGGPSPCGQRLRSRPAHHLAHPLNSQITRSLLCETREQDPRRLRRAVVDPRRLRRRRRQHRRVGNNRKHRRRPPPHRRTTARRCHHGGTGRPRHPARPPPPAAHEAPGTTAAAGGGDLDALYQECLDNGATVNLIALPDEWANYKGILAQLRREVPGRRPPGPEPERLVAGGARRGREPGRSARHARRRRRQPGQGQDRRR